MFKTILDATRKARQLRKWTMSTEFGRQLLEISRFLFDRPKQMLPRHKRLHGQRESQGLDRYPFPFEVQPMTTFIPNAFGVTWQKRAKATNFVWRQGAIRRQALQPVDRQVSGWSIGDANLGPHRK